MPYMIKTNGLCKKYGTVMTVKDLDLAVPEGSIYGFLGPNGAGKSTTLKLILGLAAPTRGTITVFGKEVNSRSRLSILKNVGSLIESPSYYGHLTGEENLRLIQTIRQVPDANVKEVLKTVRLTQQKDKKVSQYSLGMKQRLGLACALLSHPRLLILDEPTNGLDPAGIQEMRELILSLPSREQMTVVVSSHLLTEIDQLASTVGIIHKGELVFQNSLESLHARSSRRLLLGTLDNSRAANILRTNGIAFQETEDRIALPYAEDEEVASYVQLLTAEHVGITRIEEDCKSLEDIFLELTGKAVSL